LYAQIEQGIRKLPSHGQGGDRDIENAAVALTIAAHGGGLHQVDHIVLGSNGVNLFAVQGRMDDPAHRRVHVELAHAVAHASDHRSMTAAQPAPEHLRAHAIAQQQAGPRAPVMGGP
jgi:putative chitinase